MVDEERSRQHQERLHQVRELQRHPGWGTLVSLVMEMVAAKQTALIRGAAEDYADYRAKAAWCEGALWVLDVEDRERGRL